MFTSQLQDIISEAGTGSPLGEWSMPDIALAGEDPVPSNVQASSLVKDYAEALVYS